MRIFKILAIGGMAMSLGACAITSQSEIDEAATMTPKGGAFEAALQKEYIRLAKMENEDGDHPEAIYFAGKAATAASGKAPAPDDNKNRKIGKKDWGSLKGDLRRLEVMFERGGKDFAPEDMAMAQAGWDCALQEKEENMQPEEFKACLKHMNKGLAAASEKYWASLKNRKSMVIYFASGSAALNAEAKATLDEAAKAADGGKTVTLTAHTDTAGDTKRNQALSQKRAQMAADYLKAKGVEKVSHSAAGEGDLAVKTGDNVNEMKNRRVEIVIQ